MLYILATNPDCGMHRSTDRDRIRPRKDFQSLQGRYYEGKIGEGLRNKGPKGTLVIVTCPKRNDAQETRSKEGKNLG